MKRIMTTALVLAALGMGAAAQDNIVYTGVVNKVPDGFNYPLIGLFNQAQGSHASAHIGLWNFNEKDLTGAQIGLMNINGGKIDGSQVGLINTSDDRLQGLQLGFVNATDEKIIGTQIGFVNAVDETEGVQVGFVNASDKLNGCQVGFVNATDEIEGAQIGFVNATDEIDGTQVGFVNIGEETNGVEVGFVNVVEKLKGFQLGFVNVVESVESGIPFGFVTLVENGGYRALEVSTSEMFPLNLSYKLGMKQLYTSFVASYTPELPNDMIIGLGFGTNLPLSESLYFNPEVLAHNKVFTEEDNNMFSLGLNFGYCLTKKLHLTAGPSIVWNHASNPNDLYHESFSLRKWALDDHNNLFLGARIGIKYVFSDF